MSRETPPPPSDIPRNLSYIASLYERAFYASQSASAEEEEEEEEEEERGRGRLTVTRRRRPRARSLPARPESGRSRSPDTRKRVRFADSLGLELTSVHSFSRYEAPRVPVHVQAKLQRDAIRHFQNHCGGLAFKDCSPPRALEPAFANPICSEDFLQRVRQEKVCLEGVLVDGFWLRGTVRVLNVAFRKEVTVRHTLDEWRSYCDTVASYLPPVAAPPTPSLGADPQTDRFAFQLALPPYLEGRGLQLAVRYRAGGHGEYWDNDRGRNYRLCPPPRRRLSPPHPQDTDGSWVHFV